MAIVVRVVRRADAEVGSRVEVVKGRVEEISLPEPVDVLVSEPMGTLLVNERMLETYLFARDRFLVKPGGKMFPVSPLALAFVCSLVAFLMCIWNQHVLAVCIWSRPIGLIAGAWELGTVPLFRGNVSSL